MLSESYSPYGFYHSCRICFVSKIPATIVPVIYVFSTADSKFYGPLFCTSFAPGYPPVVSEKQGLYRILIPHIHILKGDAEITRFTKLDNLLEIINLLSRYPYQVVINRSLYLQSGILYQLYDLFGIFLNQPVLYFYLLLPHFAALRSLF